MQSLDIYILPSRRFIHPAECVEQVESFTQKIQKEFNSEYGPDIYNERLEIKEFLYLMEKFLAEIFQKFFDYNTKSESSRSKSSEKENTEDFYIFTYFYFKAK